MDKAPEGEEPALAAPSGESVGVVVDLAGVAGSTVPVGETTDALRDEEVIVVPVRHDESLLAPTVIVPLQASFPWESSTKRTTAVPAARATFH
jgi:hypothetical protein